MKERIYLVVWIVFAVIVLIVGVMWTSFQWNLCMEKIGDFYYCLQHIF